MGRTDLCLCDHVSVSVNEYHGLCYSGNNYLAVWAIETGRCHESRRFSR